ncbi:peptide chain release factor N(5)-glutamine methyltransferase [Thermodesulfobacteriota bacterium]
MSSKTWTIKELLQVTSKYLTEKNIESPRLCSEILLAHLLQTTRVELYLHFEKPLHDREIESYRALIRRRLAREPVQYITGVQEFWSMDFQVGPQVLIPRPESEVLVEQAVSLYTKGDMPGGEHPRILDLGTGSGALAIAVASEIGSASIWASDISEEALNIARSNAERHGLEERIQFKTGDLLTHYRPEEVTFDLILSNPPYITSSEFDALPPEVRSFEPRLALDGHEQGLYYIEKIIHQAPEKLNDNGWLLLEMDPRQIPWALEMISEDDRYGHADRIRDYSNRDRVIISQKK